MLRRTLSELPTTLRFSTGGRRTRGGPPAGRVLIACSILRVAKYIFAFSERDFRQQTYYIRSDFDTGSADLTQLLGTRVYLQNSVYRSLFRTGTLFTICY